MNPVAMANPETFDYTHDGKTYHVRKVGTEGIGPMPLQSGFTGYGSVQDVQTVDHSPSRYFPHVPVHKLIPHQAAGR
jgi:hypothetical protein